MNENVGALEAARNQANKGYLSAETRACYRHAPYSDHWRAETRNQQREHHPGGPGLPISRGILRLWEHRTVTVVADPSLALKWALSEDHTEEVLELWDRWQSVSEHLISTPVFRSEIANVLHQRIHRREISPVDAAEIMDTLLNLVDTDEPSVL